MRGRQQTDGHSRCPAGSTEPKARQHQARTRFSVLLRTIARCGLLYLVGVAGLLAKSWYSRPSCTLVHSYAGNLTASFACYFAVRSLVTLSLAFTSLAGRAGPHRATSVLITLLAAELFEATDGFFGVMSNVYDPVDYLANVIGVGLAVVADVSTAFAIGRRDNRTGDAIGDYDRDPDAARSAAAGPPNPRMQLTVYQASYRSGFRFW